MESQKKVRTAILAAAMAGLGLAVPATFADSVTLDTGIAPWMVTRNLIGGEPVPNQNGAPSQTYTAVDVAEPVYANNAWVQANTVGDGKAQWIAWTAGAGVPYLGDIDYVPTDDGTGYVYTDTLTVSGTPGNASFKISGLFAADNVVTSILLEDDTASENIPLNVTYNPATPTNYFHYTNAFSASVPNLFLSSSSQTFTLTVDVVNWDGGSYNEPESTGFLLDGTAAAVPLPTAAGVGFSLLGGFGGLAALRKRFRRRLRISQSVS